MKKFLYSKSEVTLSRLLCRELEEVVVILKHRGLLKVVVLKHRGLLEMVVLKQMIAGNGRLKHRWLLGVVVSKHVP